MKIIAVKYDNAIESVIMVDDDALPVALAVLQEAVDKTPDTYALRVVVLTPDTLTDALIYVQSHEE